MPLEPIEWASQLSFEIAKQTADQPAISREVEQPNKNRQACQNYLEFVVCDSVEREREKEWPVGKFCVCLACLHTSEHVLFSLSSQNYFYSRSFFFFFFFTPTLTPNYSHYHSLSIYSVLYSILYPSHKELIIIIFIMMMIVWSQLEALARCHWHVSWWVGGGGSISSSQLVWFRAHHLVSEGCLANMHLFVCVCVSIIAHYMWDILRCIVERPASNQSTLAAKMRR